MFLWFPLLSFPLPLQLSAATWPLLHRGGPDPAKDRQPVLDQTYGLFKIHSIDFFLSPTALDGCLMLTLISAFIYFWHRTDIADILGPFHPQRWADLKIQSILDLRLSRRSLIWATQSSPGKLRSSKPDPWDSQPHLAEAAALARDIPHSALRQSRDFTMRISSIIRHTTWRDDLKVHLTLRGSCTPTADASSGFLWLFILNFSFQKMEITSCPLPHPSSRLQQPSKLVFTKQQKPPAGSQKVK